MTDDREIYFGVGYLPSDYAYLFRYDKGDRIYYINLGYLPFLEITARLAFPDNVGKSYGIGDRSAFFRFRLISEGQRLPSVVIGIHDPLGTKFSNDSYITASKGIILKGIGAFGLHLGYGQEYIESRDHRLIGFFGGISVKCMKNLELLLEYDKEKTNGGLRYNLFSRVNIIIALLNFNGITGGINYKCQL